MTPPVAVGPLQEDCMSTSHTCKGQRRGQSTRGKTTQALRWQVQKTQHRTLNQTLIYSVNKQSVKEHLLCAMH